MRQSPAPDAHLVKWRGDTLEVTLELDSPRPGRAAFRTNAGRAAIRRAEIIDETEKGITPMAKAWTDIPLPEIAPGVFSASIQLREVGIFSGKPCFFPEGSSIPEWPEGRNFHVKVESAETRSNNSIYTVFPRQFGSFREVARRLDHIMDDMGFRIVQTLPPFPVPTTYAVMGEYGCPFAATDFFTVDPAMAEFDERATPLDQFKELIGAVHARGGLFFVDLPANHTGWASTLQTHHPEWFARESDGRFRSPGAWGVKWADLVELDYSHAGLRAYMAEVFIHWCRLGVDGFRCDAGYMITAETWLYIVARVREEYPDTVFMLEGLGGDLAVTDRLLGECDLNWAYSEIFQTYDRQGFEWYWPQAAARAEKFGTLVHFAETHDNDRLAKGGETWARLRVQLAALLSWQGAWGIANGVEWYATEKIDVHGKNDLNWGAQPNMIGLIARLNEVLRTEPSFSGPCSIRLVTRGAGNTLAALRESPADGGGEPRRLLVLANLDCGADAEIEWERGAFPSGEAIDLVTGAKSRVEGSVHLAPGQVLCLAPSEAKVRPPAAAPSQRADFRIVLPRDCSRALVAPAGSVVEASADVEFRLRLIDPATGRTLRTLRSTGRHGVFNVPEYVGDGTRARALRLDVTRYVAGRAERGSTLFFVPPPIEKARMLTGLDGAGLRLHPEWRTVLSDGAGAAAQLRLGWGAVASRYDAFLAANPNPEVPSDRLNLWIRTRCWLQREGYVREIDAKCADSFAADPAGRFARWEFKVPCGMGLETRFEFTHRLDPAANRAVLVVRRTKGGECDAPGMVRVVFRPDIDWRSFHQTTKAYLGPELEFSRAACPVGNTGFDFAPGEGRFLMRIRGGRYHHEPQWEYNVAYAEDAERGLEGSGDIFSPGWVSADLAAGDEVVFAGQYLRPGEKPDKPAPSPEFEERGDSLPLAAALAESMRLYIVRRNDLKTVIAGYPWFLDWGRDTFIFMRGMIAAGMVGESLKILLAFAAFEEKGTLPNIIYGSTAGNRDTVDAQLWFVRCVEELSAREPGLREIASLRRTCESIVRNYTSGTQNGIRVDPESGLVWSPSHFTWMDTNYPACTPREGYAVEIQALWIAALRFLGKDDLAARAADSVERLFRIEGGGYCDCLDAPAGIAAAQAKPDKAVRPNQLLLAAFGICDARAVVLAAEELVVPGGMRSLAAGDGRYRGVYTGDEDTSRKQAYHNGTAWMWQFPLFVEALAASGEVDRAKALSLLASSVENLNAGCLCQLSEIADGDAPHAEKGCAAQAWSVSELLRVLIALGGGEAR